MAGIYETYDGTVVTLLDDRGPDCQAAGHVEGAAVPELAATSQASEVTLHADGQGKA
jgi:hypothetical protein